MFMISIPIKVIQIICQLFRLDLSVMLWQCQYFMTGRFDCTCFMTAYMACLCCDHALIRLKHGTDHNPVRLRSS